MDFEIKKIKDIMFIKQGGILLFSLIGLGDKSDIISSFLEAIKSFSYELDEFGEIRSINLSKFTISYYCKNPAFYIIAIHESEIPLQILSKFLDKINSKFLERYSEEVIIKWDHNTSLFEPFIEQLKNEIQDFSKKYLLTPSELIYKLDNQLKNRLFEDKQLLAISYIYEDNIIQTELNNNLKDYELQVYISSPYYRRTILNLGQMLTSIGKILLKSQNLCFIIKSRKFYLGIKQIKDFYLGIIGMDYNSIKNAFTKI